MVMMINMMMIRMMMMMRMMMRMIMMNDNDDCYIRMYIQWL